MFVAFLGFGYQPGEDGVIHPQSNETQFVMSIHRVQAGYRDPNRHDYSGQGIPKISVLLEAYNEVLENVSLRTCLHGTSHVNRDDRIPRAGNRPPGNNDVGPQMIRSESIARACHGWDSDTSGETLIVTH